MSPLWCECFFLSCWRVGHSSLLSAVLSPFAEGYCFHVNLHFCSHAVSFSPLPSPAFFIFFLSTQLKSDDTQQPTSQPAERFFLHWKSLHSSTKLLNLVCPVWNSSHMFVCCIHATSTKRSSQKRHTSFLATFKKKKGALKQRKRETFPPVKSMQCSTCYCDEIVVVIVPLSLRHDCAMCSS